MLEKHTRKYSVPAFAVIFDVSRTIYRLATRASFNSQKVYCRFSGSASKFLLIEFRLFATAAAERPGRGRREWNYCANTTTRNSRVFRNICPRLRGLEIAADASSAYYLLRPPIDSRFRFRCYFDHARSI